MREAFNRQLTELRQELVYIYANIDLQLHEALDALEEGNREKAKAVKAETRRLDDRCAALEQKAFMLIATQQPVASDLRLIQFVIYANFNLARMSNHVRNIAKTAKRCAGRDVPAQLIDLLVGEGHLVYGVLSNCVMAIVNEDLRLASSLPVLDEPVDDLYKQFFRRLSTLGPDDDKDAASRVIMASRMLERISDNAVEVGEKLVFLLTGKRRNLDDLQDLDDDDLADRYERIDAALRGAGYDWYEVSNWAKPGGECLHNMIYWRDGDWWGAGPGAHSHIGGRRFHNVKHPARYASIVSGGELPIRDTELLSDDDRHIERVMLRLRLSEGMPQSDLRPEEIERARAQEAAGMLTLADGRVRLTDAGRLLADAIIVDILS